jgi:glycosyltransferase involved in cell wall biosynthesis
LQAEVEQRGLTNVKLHGFVDDIPAFLENLDIYLQPSRWEGLCITVLEAMATGLPVVGSSVGGIRRNVEEGISGHLYEPNDIDGFVSGIETLSADPDRRSEFGERGRRMVSNRFTRDVLVTEFEKAISENN